MTRLKDSLDRSSKTLRSPDLKRYQMAPFEVLHKIGVDHALFVWRLPLFILSKNKKEELEYPDKVTLKWLWSHVPYSFWIFLISLLVAAFSLGITLANTKLYNSLTDLLTPNSNINKQIAPKIK